MTRKSINHIRQQAVIEQFDRDSHAYVSKNVRPETVRERQRLLDLAQGGNHFRRALDLGCGPGTVSQDLLGVADEVWGVDSSPGMIALASAGAKEARLQHRLHFEVGGAEALNFPDGSFDVVFCVGVLRYLDSWEAGLREIYRVLAPDGIVIATFYYRFSLQWFYMCLLGRPLLPLAALLKRRSLKNCLAALRAEPLPFSYRKFRKAFLQTGFTGMELQHSGFELYPLRRLFPRLSRHVYLKLESLFFRSGTFGWLGSICVVKGVKSPAAFRFPPTLKSQNRK